VCGVNEPCDTVGTQLGTGLTSLVLYFYFRNHVFLHPDNLTNLFIQSTVFILLGMAEIWLLLLGVRALAKSTGWTRSRRR
jgi:ABC-type xylose transport system permease subunit